MRKLRQDAMRNFGSFGIIFILVTVGSWLIFMILLPQLIMLDFSFRPFLPLRKIGGPEDIYTLKIDLPDNGEKYVRKSIKIVL